ncbi:MAG: hypothetical protein IJS07_04660, partial [Bacteroidales bacterium]|nr:hypothetical protein [Bacteroidales bacterium]
HVVLIAIVFVAAYSYVFDSKLDLNGDNATYIELARNMADGHGYCHIGPGGTEAPANHFPVGYPFILSVLITLGLDNLIAFKILNGIFMLAALLLLYFTFRGLTAGVGKEGLAGDTAQGHGKGAGSSRAQAGQNQAGAAMALTFTLLAAVSVQLLRFASMAMSEMSYMAVSMLCLFALMMLARDGLSSKDGQVKTEDRKEFGAWFWVAVVSAAAGYYIRAVGASLAFTLLIFFLVRGEWKRAAVGTGGIIALISPWFIRGKVLGLKTRYLAPILAKNYWRPDEGQISSVGEFLEKTWTNLDDTVLRGFHSVLFQGWQGYATQPTKAGTIVLGFIILAIVIYGLWSLKPMRWALLAFLAANIGFLLLWNGGNDIRYVTPFIPVVFMGFWNGVYTLLVKIIRPLAKFGWLPYLALLVALGSITPLKNQHKAASMPTPPAYRNFYALASAFKDVPKTGDVVVCNRKPGLFKYYAPKVVSVSYLYTADSKALISRMVDQKVDFVVLEQLGYSSTPMYLYPAITAYPELFEIVQVIPKPDTYLLRFHRDKAAQMLTE